MSIRNLTISATLSEATRQFNELGVSAKGTTPHAGGENRDAAFHDYMVAKHLESVAKKRAEVALETLRGLSKADDDTWNTSRIGMNLIDSTKRYILNCEVKGGASRVDPKALVSTLAKRGVKADVLDAAVKDATVCNNPSRTYRVIAND